jgi:type I restriction enzyme S subunit
MTSQHTTTVSQVATTRAGGTPSRSRKDFFGGGIPWVKSGEVDSILIEDTEESLSDEGLHASTAQLLPAGTTLVALYGATAGKVGRLGIEAATNQAVLAVQANDSRDRDYLFYAIQYSSPALLRRLQGGAQPNLSGQMVRDLQLPWPSKRDRDQLVRLASSFDTAITAAEMASAAKRRLKRALMQELLKGTQRFRSFGLAGNGNKPPSGWQPCRLSDIATVRFSSVDKKSACDEIPVRLCNYLDVWRNDRIEDTMPFMAATATADEVNKFALLEGDVLLTKDSETREDIASTAWVRSAKNDMVLGYHLALVRPNKHVANGGFVAKQLMLPDFRKHFIRAATGATRYGLSLGSVLTAVVWLPSLAEQEAICRALDHVIDEEQLLESLIATLRSQRAGTIHRFFGGTTKDP